MERARGRARTLFVFKLPGAGVWVMPAVIAVMGTAGVVACWLPVRRALGIRPVDALRDDG
jgi:ABC-type antimicrobial peptide transport system permease subunit